MEILTKFESLDLECSNTPILQYSNTPWIVHSDKAIASEHMKKTLFSVLNQNAQLIGYCFSTESQHSFGTVRPWSVHFCRFQVAEVTSNMLGDLCRSQ
jgi:hypothetical protein